MIYAAYAIGGFIIGGVISFLITRALVLAAVKDFVKRQGGI